MSIQSLNVAKFSLHTYNTNTNNSHSIDRSKVRVSDGEGNVSKRVHTSFGNGNEITRTQTRTANTDGSFSLTGKVTSVRGETTFSGNVAADKMSAELTISGPKGNTKTMSFTRGSTEPGPQPEPLPPVSNLPIEEPMAVMPINFMV